MSIANNELGFLFWIMGFSGAGKSEIAATLVSALRARGVPVVWLDGDEIRRSLTLIGHDTTTRIEVGKKLVNLSLVLNRQGYHVILSSIGMRQTLDHYARQYASNYRSILVNASVEFITNLGKRDIYKDGTENVMGKDLNPDNLNYDLKVENSKVGDLAKATSVIESFCLQEIDWRGN